MQDAEPAPHGVMDSTTPVAGPDPRTSHERSAIISALATGGMLFEPRMVDLGAVVQQVVIEYGPNALAAGSVLRPQLALVVGHWDPRRLRDVVVELIYNAINHADGKPIDVAVSAIGDQAQLVVQDHGAGVPAHNHDMLFEPALLVLGAAVRFGNGLWLTRALATAMGGTAELAPSDTGARFVVTLPRRLGP